MWVRERKFVGPDIWKLPIQFSIFISKSQFHRNKRDLEKCSILQQGTDGAMWHKCLRFCWPDNHKLYITQQIQIQYILLFHFILLQSVFFYLVLNLHRPQLCFFVFTLSLHSQFQFQGMLMLSLFFPLPISLLFPLTHTTQFPHSNAYCICIPRLPLSKLITF